MCIDVWVYICIYTYTYIWMNLCISYTFTLIYIYLSICICIYIYSYICIYYSRACLVKFRAVDALCCWCWRRMSRIEHLRACWNNKHWAQQSKWICECIGLCTYMCACVSTQTHTYIQSCIIYIFMSVLVCVGGYVYADVDMYIYVRAWASETVCLRVCVCVRTPVAYQEK